MRFRKSAHAVYKTQYHVVWTPRYRRELFQNNIKHELKHLISNLPELEDDIEVRAVNIQPDHIHLILVIPPRGTFNVLVQHLALDQRALG